MQLKIFLLSQSENNKYDTYDSMIVCAESAEAAKSIHPDKDYYSNDNGEDLWKSSWGGWATSPKNVDVKYLGIADEKLKKNEILCASFNAG